MKPGGRFASLFRTNASQAVGAFPADVYKFPLLDEIRAALERTGLRGEAVDAASELSFPVQRMGYSSRRLERRIIVPIFAQMDILPLSRFPASASVSAQGISGFRKTLLPLETPSPYGTRVPYSSNKSKRMAFLPSSNGSVSFAGVTLAPQRQATAKRASNPR